MARRKTVYEAGELDKLRKNLGDISPDEAKKIARLLGGEVGFEKAPSDVEASYRRLENARNKIIPGKTRPDLPELPGATENSPSGNRHRAGSRKHAAEGTIPSSYLDRIRLDFFMAQPEFSIKTQGQAFLSFFDFSGKRPDFMNPWFVKSSIQHVSNHVDTLREAIKTLIPSNKPSRKAELSKNVLASLVVDEILHWNVEELKAETIRLVRDPKTVTVASCEPFVKILFTPIIKMFDLNTDKHLIPVLETVLKTAFMDAAQDEHERLYAAANSAQKTIDSLFRETRYLWYPIFLKLITGKWYPFSQFMNLQRAQILAFFGLRESELINFAMVKRITEDRTAKEEQLQIEKREEERTEESVKRELPPKRVQKGLEILDMLFPRAGWLDLDDHPDLYAYFKLILSLAPGIDAVPLDDPLLPAYILTEILEELFYGFDSISFKKDQPLLRDQSTNLASIISRWHIFLDEFLQKRYLAKLQDICRMAETNPETRYSSYVKKQQSDMLWLKRYYLFPGLVFEIMIPNKPSREKEIPVMYEIVPDLIGILQVVAQDIDAGMKQQKEHPEIPVIFTRIGNPLEQFKFTVQNPLSWRLKLLYSDGKSSIRANNANLIFCTLSILYVLEWVLTREYEPIGTGMSYLPFRNINGKPNYGNAAGLDPDELFRREIERRKTLKEAIQ